jgi:uncharacterized protein
MLGFVTGASSGVGQAFADRLAADGWDLHITARREDRLRALAQRLTEQCGVRVQVHAADLTSPGDLARLEEAIAAAGPDLLVNNAGFAGYREFPRVDPQVISGLIEVHALAVTRLTRAAVPAMLARGSGAIINMASLLAYSGPIPPQPLPHRATYAAVKAFQVTFTQALAAELTGTGVQVQACCPGLVDTEFHALAGRDLAAAPFPVMRARRSGQRGPGRAAPWRGHLHPGPGGPRNNRHHRPSPAGTPDNRGQLTASRPIPASLRGGTAGLLD